MSLRRTCATTLVMVACIGVGHSARAQNMEPPTNAAIQAGPLVVAPVVRLTNFGHDSNVFNTDSSSSPRGDVTATLSPAMDGWLRLAHGRAGGRTQFDIYYFKQLKDLRAVDSDSSGRVEVPLNRFRPYVAGSFMSTRHRQNLELDAIARRRIRTMTVGTDVRLTAKLTASLFALRNRLDYDTNSIYLDTDLSQVLNFTSRGEGAELRYALTPLTTVGIRAERVRDRFDATPDRNSDSFNVTPMVEFNPRALISGSASFGFKQRKILAGTAPTFNGSVASADLTYTLLGRTRFTVAGRRQLEYSYIVGRADYLESSLALGVNQRFGDSWDVGGRITRSRLSYGDVSLATDSALIIRFPDETIIGWSADAGYRLARTRIGVRVEQRERQASAELRGYERFRIGSTLTYEF
ncbi:MAG: outer membrane beta-barrel protein [Vicinamibacterales bacterium]